MHYSTSPRAPEKGAAAHIKKAFTNPKGTQPPNAKKDVPGKDLRKPLHRNLDRKRNDDNREAARKNCRKYFGKNYSQGNKYDCDEFPFAATYEGSAQHDYDRNTPVNNFSVQPVIKKENGAGGALLLSFFAKYRILEGNDDAFIVKIDQR
ncbi:hypothetical protein I5Q34_32265 [Streptomyces sp. AV19]|uniref:NucA/NucB deoxyribonuclease domain-containing protein n=1 Tax=Streptomyces sp. AV19 TaxID=2793068 RepID=UPI0018FEE49E|nr:hypothetical protein [Streptomyces sp. AV19]MBH1938881.1 hypothetical protein [Streptomyces sp. AV19]MDG4533500.1 hypothetical protein [Streptomyces sp. AV19]